MNVEKWWVDVPALNLGLGYFFSPLKSAPKSEVKHWSQTLRRSFGGSWELKATHYAMPVVVSVGGMCLCSDCGSLLRSARGVSLWDLHRSSEETSQLNFSYSSTNTPCLSTARLVTAACAMFTCSSEVLMHIGVNACAFPGERRTISAALCTWQNSTGPMPTQWACSTE